MSTPLIVALDFPDEAAALAMADRLDPTRARVKVGKELFTRAGPGCVRRLIERGFDVFLDLKYHDIPNTVAGALAAAAELGVWMVNVHASGGPKMLAAARAAIPADSGGPLVTAVTVLTSLDSAQLTAIGVTCPPAEQVLRLARLTAAAGLDGVVCSAQEAPSLRAALPVSFGLVTPGIRPAGAHEDDQQRRATPEAALAAGATWLVVGRPITRAPDPDAAVSRILAGLG